MANRRINFAICYISFKTRLSFKMHRERITASTDTRSLCVASLTTGGVFAASSCGARTTIEKIILNRNVRGEDKERKGRVLAISRKRADIP